jgi:DNA primase
LQSEKLDLLQQSFGNYYCTGEEYLFHCPKCNHYKNKLSINLTRDVFKCWICEYSGNSISSLFKRFVSLTGQTTEPYMRHAISYLKSRGICKKSILRWKIGCFSGGSYNQRVCIPSFSAEGDLNYFVTRTYGDSFFKYKNPNASKDIIFNDLYVDWNKPIVLVEGVFDAMKCDNSIPILGSTLKENSKLFQKIVKKNSIVYLAFDKDAKKKELNLAKKLLEYGITVYKIDIDPFNDVGEMTPEQFLEHKKEASIVSMTDYLYQNLIF